MIVIEFTISQLQEKQKFVWKSNHAAVDASMEQHRSVSELIPSIRRLSLKHNDQIATQDDCVKN